MRKTTVSSNSPYSPNIKTRGFIKNKLQGKNEKVSIKCKVENKDKTLKSPELSILSDKKSNLKNTH